MANKDVEAYAYPVEDGYNNQYNNNQQGYNANGVQQQSNQPHQGAYQPPVIAQPYNGPAAQQATTAGGHHVRPGANVVVVRRNNQEGAVRKPSSHCCLAWFSCLFCCWPLGLFAIFQAYQVNAAFERLDFDKSYRASQLAKKASIAAIICGIIIIVVCSVTETRSTSGSSHNGKYDNDD